MTGVLAGAAAIFATGTHLAGAPLGELRQDLVVPGRADHGQPDGQATDLRQGERDDRTPEHPGGCGQRERPAAQVVPLGSLEIDGRCRPGGGRLEEVAVGAKQRAESLPYAGPVGTGGLGAGGADLRRRGEARGDARAERWWQDRTVTLPCFVHLDVSEGISDP